MTAGILCSVALKHKNRIYKLTDVACLVITCITFMQDLRKNEKWEIRLGIVGPEAFPDDNETKNPSKCLYFSYIVSLCPSAALTETAGK